MPVGLITGASQGLGRAILNALAERGYRRVTLDIIGRKGWGDDWARLSAAVAFVMQAS